MMKAMRISSTQINSSLRLNGGFHLSEAVIYENQIKRGTWADLRTLTEEIFTAGRSRRVYISDSTKGYPYLGNSDVLSSNPLEGCKYVSAKYSTDKKAFLKAGMILTARVGAIGNVAYVGSDLTTAMGSDNIIRIVAKPSFPSGYLYAYFQSVIGNTFLHKLATGGVQPYISEEMLAHLPIPILPDVEQQAIHTAIETAARLRVEANGLLGQAEQEFLDNLGLDADTYKRLTAASERDTAAEFVVSSTTLSARTIRSRNYAQRLSDIVAALTVGKHDQLVNVLQREPYYTGRFKRLASSSSSAVELYSQGDIFALKPQGQMISPRTVPTSGKVLTEKGSILVAGVGTLGENEIFGRAKFVWGYLEGKLVAQHIIRFEPDEDVIDPGYLFAVINSKLWFRIFRSSVCGTNLLGFIVPMLNQMPIPRFDKAIEDAIGQKVKTAYEKMTEANQLETGAIARVEELVGSW